MVSMMPRVWLCSDLTVLELLNRLGNLDASVSRNSDIIHLRRSTGEIRTRDEYAIVEIRGRTSLLNFVI